MAYDFNPFTGTFDDKGKSTATLDLRYLKLTGSLAEVTNHSHTVLTDIGTNTHAQIDSHITDSSDPHGSTLTQSVALITPKIYPSADSTTAIQINKADGTTNVFTVDTTNGRFGVGTTAPSALVHASSTVAGLITATRYGVSSGGAPLLSVQGARGTAANPTAVLSGDFLGVLSFQGYTGSAFSGTRIGVEGYAAEDWSTTNQGTYLTFSTTPTADTGRLERMRIDAGGNIGIGTVTPGAVASIATVGGRMLSIANIAGRAAATIEGSTDARIYLSDTGAGVDSKASVLGTDGGFTYFKSLSDAGALVKDILWMNHSSGNIGIGVTGPTAKLHLIAGTATQYTAPLKFNSGTLNTTPEAGAMEFLTDALYFTITTGAARKTIAFLESPSFTTPTLGAATCTTLAVAGNQVVGARVVDARIDDTPNSGDATTDGILAAIQTCLINHGLAAAA